MFYKFFVCDFKNFKIKCQKKPPGLKIQELLIRKKSVKVVIDVSTHPGQVHELRVQTGKSRLNVEYVTGEFTHRPLNLEL